jgi:hypothetical protein
VALDCGDKPQTRYLSNILHRLGWHLAEPSDLSGGHKRIKWDGEKCSVWVGDKSFRSAPAQELRAALDATNCEFDEDHDS